MKVNPHQFSCVNSGYQLKERTLPAVNLGSGVQLPSKTARTFRETGNAVSGTEFYDKYVAECNELFKSAFIECDFWLRITNKIYIGQRVERWFSSDDYTILELLSISNGITTIRSYKHEDYEKYLLNSCVNTVKSRIINLDGVLCAVESAAFLENYTNFWVTTTHDI